MRLYLRVSFLTECLLFKGMHYHEQCVSSQTHYRLHNTAHPLTHHASNAPRRGPRAREGELRELSGRRRRGPAARPRPQGRRKSSAVRGIENCANTVVSAQCFRFSRTQARERGGGCDGVNVESVENTQIHTYYVRKVYGILPSNMDLYTSLDLVTRLVCTALFSPESSAQRRRGGEWGGVG